MRSILSLLHLAKIKEQGTESYNDQPHMKTREPILWGEISGLPPGLSYSSWNSLSWALELQQSRAISSGRCQSILSEGLVSVAARPPARALRRLISPGAAPVVIARKVILDKLTCKCLLLFPRCTPQRFHWVKQLWIRFKVAADLLVAGILGPQVRCEM